MTINLLWQWQVKCHKNTRPDNRMETDNLLAHQMNISWPELAESLWIIQKADWGKVIGKCIKPYINNMLIVDRYRYTPIEGCTRNTEILQPLLDKINHLIAAAYRLNKLRIIINIFQQTVCIT